jgi:hypothetical protein
MFCDNKTAINIAYNRKIGDQAKHINIVYHLVRENVDRGWTPHLPAEPAEHLTDIHTKVLPLVTLQQLRSAIMDTK